MGYDQPSLIALGPLISRTKKKTFTKIYYVTVIPAKDFDSLIRKDTIHEKNIILYQQSVE